MKVMMCRLMLFLAVLLLAGCGSQEAPVETTAPAVQKLILEQPPRVDYVEGETFDPTGMIVHAQMSDGTTVENVSCEIEVDMPLNRKTLFAHVSYGGKSMNIQLRVFLQGNDRMYAAENVQPLEDSPLKGKTIFWLGSSVTLGSNSGNESMADFIAAKHGAVCIKNAVSGTKLADTGKESYVARLEAYLASAEKAEELDAFVCQLSTNDKNAPENFGEVTALDVKDISAFDKTTTFGAMEYIIATVRSNWDCPIYFYTNPYFADTNYKEMVEKLELIAWKWDITIIHLYRDEAFNEITEEERTLYLSDSIHPTKAGYLLWWLPKFEEALTS